MITYRLVVRDAVKYVYTVSTYWIVVRDSIVYVFVLACVCMQVSTY